MRSRRRRVRCVFRLVGKNLWVRSSRRVADEGIVLPPSITTVRRDLLCCRESSNTAVHKIELAASATRAPPGVVLKKHREHAARPRSGRDASRAPRGPAPRGAAGRARVVRRSSDASRSPGDGDTDGLVRAGPRAPSTWLFSTRSAADPTARNCSTGGSKKDAARSRRRRGDARVEDETAKPQVWCVHEPWRPWALAAVWCCVVPNFMVKPSRCTAWSGHVPEHRSEILANFEVDPGPAVGYRSGLVRREPRAGRAAPAAPARGGAAGAVGRGLGRLSRRRSTGAPKQTLGVRGDLRLRRRGRRLARADRGPRRVRVPAVPAPALLRARRRHARFSARSFLRRIAAPGLPRGASFDASRRGGDVAMPWRRVAATGATRTYPRRDARLL